MKGSHRICLGMALCAVLLLLPAFASDGVSEIVYFMAVNDTILELEESNMPRVVNGVVYVPHTMFESGPPDANLSLFSSYNAAQGTVMIYNRSQTIVFDLTANNLTIQGEVQPDCAIIRNGIAFVPVDAVCRAFSLKSSRLQVAHGYLIRVKNNAAVVNDKQFVDAAASTMDYRYDLYMQNKYPVESPSPTPDASTTPSSDSPTSMSPSVDVPSDSPGSLPSPEPSSTPSSSPSPTPSEEPSPPEPALLYLGFRMDDGESFDAILNLLAQQKVSAIFFCRTDDLVERDDDIRSLLAAGHRIGFILDANTPFLQQLQAREGRETLSHIAKCTTTFCISENLDEPSLPDDSFVLWRTTLSVPDGQSAQQMSEAVLQSLQRDLPNFTLLDDSSKSLRITNDLLHSEQCLFALANEIILSAE